jgi:hypothetical protein
VNPKVKVRDVCGNKYSLPPSYAEIEFLDLLRMTGFGVGYLAGGSMGAGVATA